MSADSTPAVFTEVADTPTILVTFNATPAVLSIVALPAEPEPGGGTSVAGAGAGIGLSLSLAL
jgi:hypothetical protein